MWFKIYKFITAVKSLKKKKKLNLLISGIFNLIFWYHRWREVTETEENETTD
jgi:hypothetical protein